MAERKLSGTTIFVDLDGTQNRFQIGPFPFPVVSIGTMKHLLKRDFPAEPKTGEDFPYIIEGNLKEKLDHIWHSDRPLTTDSADGLQILAYMRDMFPGSGISIEVLSGRKRHLHDMTRRVLSERRIKGYYDAINLNTFHGSVVFKEKAGNGALIAGRKNVVLIDDDLAAADRFAGLQEFCHPGQNVLVELIDNPSNHPWLVRRSGYEMPDNIQRARTFLQAATNIRDRLLAF